MNQACYKKIWMQEEEAAHICGWDFSHIQERYTQGDDLPWDYREVVQQYLRHDMDILDYDTGGGEFLLSLHHPYARTAATEGYSPNVALCQERLLPLGIQFRACHDSSAIPFEDEAFDLVLNRHGSFYSRELLRILRPGGLFITEQVGAENDRDLVKLIIPEAPKPFPHQTLAEQRHQLENTGFHILQAEEAFRPIRFYDIGAFVWFARIIAWEFPGFSVARCWAQLLHLQRSLEKNGVLGGTIHRFLLVARKQ